MERRWIQVSGTMESKWKHNGDKKKENYKVDQVKVEVRWRQDEGR